MRCRIILISNFDYRHVADLADSPAAGALWEDTRLIFGDFHKRFEAEDVGKKWLLNLGLRAMERLDRTLEEDFSAAADGEEEPFLRDGDFVVLWVAGYGMSFRDRGGAVLLPADVGSAEAPWESALADRCGVMSKILEPVRRLNGTGVTHLVLNLFRLPGDCSPALDLSCIAGTNVHILASFARSPELLFRTGDCTPTDHKATSTLFHHYRSALLAGDTFLEDVCRRAIAGASRDSQGQLVPRALHSLAEPSAGPAAAGRVAAFAWGGARRPAAGGEPGPPAAAAPAAAAQGWSGASTGAAADPFNEWGMLTFRRGPQKMRVATIGVEGPEGRAFQLPRGLALRNAMLLFAEKRGFVALALGPHSVEIYHGCSSQDLQNASTECSDWDLYVRPPCLQYGMWPAAGRMASAGWAAVDVNMGRAVDGSSTPAAKLTFLEDARRAGFIDFEDSSFLAALRLLCDAKSFAAASVRMEKPLLDPVEENPLVELNPEEEQRKCSGVAAGYTLGKLDASKPWCPTENSVGQWLLLDLGKAQLVLGLVVQGHPGNAYPNHHVTEMMVECGYEEGALHPVSDPAGHAAHMVPTGQNGAANERLLVNFPQGPVVARYVKVRPMKPHNVYFYLRVGVQVQKSRCCEVGLYRGMSRQQILDRSVEDAESTLYCR